MILRKDYVKLIQEGKAQVEVERTEEHNEMLNLIFPSRVRLGANAKDMGRYYTIDSNSFYDYHLRDNTPNDNLPIIHASDIILDNAVIKVESLEHGKKVIEWWKEQGVDVEYNFGCIIGDYYGLYNGKFYFHSEGYAKEYRKKIITLPESLPEKWYMVCDDNNKALGNEWLIKMKGHTRGMICGNAYCGSREQGFYFGFGGFAKTRVPEEYPEYKEITFEQFLKHVYKPWKNKSIEITKQENKMRTITWEQGQSIIDIAFVDWKGKLFDIWARPIVMKEPIEIKEEFYKEMRKACTKEQHELFDRIFGKEKEEIDLRSGVNDYCLFHSNAPQSETMIGIRSGKEYGGKAFFLSEDFNWEIKKDSNGVLCLIPTHK